MVPSLYALGTWRKNRPPVLLLLLVLFPFRHCIMDRQPTSAEMRFNQQKFLTDDNTPNESHRKAQELPPLPD